MDSAEEIIRRRKEKDKQPWMPEEVSQMRQLAGEGKTAWAIADRLGRMSEGVEAKAKELGIELTLPLLVTNRIEEEGQNHAPESRRRDH